MIVGAIKVLGLGPVLVCTILLAADTKQPMIGKPAPAFVLQNLDGKTVELSDFKGKYVVLHFGTGW
jgi:cytochrome oxidase Cu insertion factor (SCO1/SenC/PrrC family)